MRRTIAVLVTALLRCCVRRGLHGFCHRLPDAGSARARARRRRRNWRRALRRRQAARLKHSARWRTRISRVGSGVVTGGTQATGDRGATVAVIANGDAFRSQLEPLKGQQVRVIGTRSDGVSIRMAGPESSGTSPRDTVGRRCHAPTARRRRCRVSCSASGDSSAASQLSSSAAPAPPSDGPIGPVGTPRRRRTRRARRHRRAPRRASRCRRRSPARARSCSAACRR